MVRPERKAVGWKQGLVDKYSNPGKLVLDLFCSTLVTVKEQLDFPRHLLFVGCEVNANCIAASTEELVETCSRQYLNKKSDISVTGNMLDEVNTVVRALDGLRDEKWMR